MATSPSSSSSYQEFHEAVRWHRKDQVRTLAETIDVNIADDHGTTALHMIIDFLPEPQEMIEVLLDVGADINKIIECEHMDMCYYPYETPLGTACRQNKPQVARFLLERGANVNGDARNPPIFATTNEGCLQVLLEYAASSSVVVVETTSSPQGLTPILKWAKALIGSPIKDPAPTKIGRLFMDHGANPNTVDRNGQTPLCIAAKKGSLDFVKMILEYDRVDVNIKDMNGSTALHLAAGSENYHTMQQLGHTDDYEKIQVEVCRLLVERGANVMARDGSEGWTPMHDAAWSGCNHVIRYLATTKQNSAPILNAKDNQGYTPLMLAVYAKKPETVKCFVEDVKADIHVQTEHGFNATLQSISTDQADLFEYLVKHGGDWKVVDGDGDGALHNAAEVGSLKICKILVEELGANKELTNKAGKTPLDVAREHEKLEVVQFLEA